MAHVVFLRGVNVGGSRRFQPSALVRELAHLGAVNLGAAGTFVIRKHLSEAALRSEFASRLPFTTELMICRSGELEKLARHRSVSHQRTSPRPAPLRQCPGQEAASAAAPPLQLPTRERLAGPDSGSIRKARLGLVAATGPLIRRPEWCHREVPWGPGHDPQLEHRGPAVRRAAELVTEM